MQNVWAGMILDLKAKQQEVNIPQKEGQTPI